MSTPKKNYKRHTNQNRTGIKTLPCLANVLTTTKNHSSDWVSPSLTTTSYNSILKKSTTKNKFDKQDMLIWEQSTAIIKNNFDQTKAYFEKIVKATNIYKQNTGGNSA
jgi:hypothetical protein